MLSQAEEENLAQFGGLVLLLITLHGHEGEIAL